MLRIRPGLLVFRPRQRLGTPVTEVDLGVGLPAAGRAFDARGFVALVDEGLDGSGSRIVARCALPYRRGGGVGSPCLGDRGPAHEERVDGRQNDQQAEREKHVSRNGRRDVGDRGGRVDRLHVVQDVQDDPPADDGRVPDDCPPEPTQEQVAEPGETHRQERGERREQSTSHTLRFRWPLFTPYGVPVVADNNR